MIAKEYQDRIAEMLAGGQRKLLGIVGPPGSGKSTISQAILELAGALAVVVPMDGFHLANAELVRLGRASRKGAEDTFDSAGFVALLQRIRCQKSSEIIYAPEFRREIEEPIANAIPIVSDKRLVIVEGNYLLLESGPWRDVRGLLDEVWYVEVDHEVRRGRLIQRHMQFGRSEDEAKAWVASTDEPNAVLIESTKSRADVLVKI
ncbi:nucleoside/nucleotide kinase family protein [Hahella sp. CCB-MM4]|uniref:nucleoside/nucleotide kinase family protein n=1 Tax=Hahella sp. (strain CCB-MM4) TaxID=1926491 RepID=UPI000B9B0793|nr:nucleoside/nucleotide kinase family protein [Hahella sp. CCB-MM4]OZG71571.1 nucleoside/nucleotide kinase family protein [Hahella sp. CCB-MM4]